MTAEHETAQYSSRRQQRREKFIELVFDLDKVDEILVCDRVGFEPSPDNFDLAGNVVDKNLVLVNDLVEDQQHEFGALRCRKFNFSGQKALESRQAMERQCQEDVGSDDEKQRRSRELQIFVGIGIAHEYIRQITLLLETRHLVRVDGVLQMAWIELEGVDEVLKLSCRRISDTNPAAGLVFVQFFDMFRAEIFVIVRYHKQYLFSYYTLSLTFPGMEYNHGV